MPAHKKPTRTLLNTAARSWRGSVCQNGDLEYLTPFNKRKFCDRHCMASAFDQRHSPVVGWSTALSRSENRSVWLLQSLRSRMRAMHHLDGNHLNNSPENLERICRSCHVRSTTKGSCMICGKPQGLWGYCDKHHQRFKKGRPAHGPSSKSSAEGFRSSWSRRLQGAADRTGKYHDGGIAASMLSKRGGELWVFSN